MFPEAREYHLDIIPEVRNDPRIVPSLFPPSHPSILKSIHFYKLPRPVIFVFSKTRI